MTVVHLPISEKTLPHAPVRAVIVDCGTLAVLGDTASADHWRRIVMKESEALPNKMRTAPREVTMALRGSLSGHVYPGLFLFDGVNSEPVAIPIVLRFRNSSKDAP